MKRRKVTGKAKVRERKKKGNLKVNTENPALIAEERKKHEFPGPPVT